MWMKLPMFRNGSKRILTWVLLIASPSFYRQVAMSHRAHLHEPFCVLNCYRCCFNLDNIIIAINYINSFQ